MAEAQPPIDIIEDNLLNTISFTPNPLYDITEHEMSFDAGSTWEECTTSTIDVSEKGHLAPNDFQVRVKAVVGGDDTVLSSNSITPYRLWTPLDAPVTLFINAMDESTIESTISSADKINDLSGNGYHFTATGGARPQTGTRTENGVNVLDFNGSTNMVATSFPPMSNDKSMVFMVLIDDAGVGNGAKYFGQQVGISGRHYLEAQVSYQFGGDYNENETAFQTGFNLLAGYRNGTEVGVGYNGEYTLETQSFTTPSFTDLYLGCVGGNQAFLNGAIAVFAMFDSYSLDVRLRMEGWCAWGAGTQAGLDVGHPYKLAPPTTQEQAYVYAEDEFGNPQQDENGIYIMVEA